MKPFTLAAVIVFAVVAIVQLTRLILGWDVVVNGVAIPMWASVIALVVAGGLAAMVARENRSRAP
ncbi:MAG: hypothetical protein H7Y14_04735 [Burkholderiales bacterium]|nr:hypothetical protein [Burkholderiales bacterium]